MTEVADDTTPTLGGDLDANDKDIHSILTASFEDEHDNGSQSGAHTVNWNNGNKQKITLTGNPTLTFTAPPGATNLQLKVIQDGTGSRTITWPSIKWPEGTAPTLTTDASAEDLVFLYYDGSAYYGSSLLDFATPA
jgi:hypothetical protein